MGRWWRNRLRAVVLVVASSSVAACGGGSASPGPGATGASSESTASSPTPNPTAALPSPVDWNTLLTLAPCPAPRTVDPACLDAAATGDVPARTSVVHVGGEVGISFAVDNAGPTASPPITVLLFTFEPPSTDSFIRVVACDGCTVDASGTALEWPALSPGEHRLTATLKAIGHPTVVPGGGVKVGDDYEWLAGFFALPVSAVLNQPDGIDTSLAFALSTGETTIKAR